MKKNLFMFIIANLLFSVSFYSEKYIKEYSESYQYEKTPKMILKSVFEFDNNGILKQFDRSVKIGDETIIYQYLFEYKDGVYKIRLKKENDYISSVPDSDDLYILSKKNDKWTLYYDNEILGQFIYDKNKNNCSFLDYETKEVESFFEQKDGKYILYFQQPYEYSLKNNIFHDLNKEKKYKTEYKYDFNTETYEIYNSFEGLDSKTDFSRDYYCTDFEQICLMWIARYKFGGEILPYLFCKLDRAYHASSYLTEGTTTYEPEHLQKKDGLPWASGNGKGIGDVISIKEFEHKNPSTLKIINGYQDKNHPDYYEKNSRLKKIKVRNTDTKKSKTIVVKDIKEEQVFDLSDLGRGQNYDIEILDVYEGNKYQDLCIQYMVLE